jgi:hypothetical protein
MEHTNYGDDSIWLPQAQHNEVEAFIKAWKPGAAALETKFLMSAKTALLPLSPPSHALLHRTNIVLGELRLSRNAELTLALDFFTAINRCRGSGGRL